MADIEIRPGCLTIGDPCYGEGPKKPVNTPDDSHCCGKFKDGTGTSTSSDDSAVEKDVAVVGEVGGDNNSIGCKDPDAINYDEDADENCGNFSCCKYEDQSRDPIDCGNALKQSKLEVEINTIDS